MQSINIKNIEISFNLTVILNALKQNNSVEIDIHGKVYIDESVHESIPIIFRCKEFNSHYQIMDAVTMIQQIFKDYKPRIEGTICTIKPLIAWQDVIELNKDRMLYFDHQSDGVELFEDKMIEDMGWEATALDIHYRQIAQHIEMQCDGYLVCYENEMHFNGFFIAKDIVQVRSSVKSFIITQIKEKIEQGEIDCDDYDTQEALEFFGVEI